MGNVVFLGTNFKQGRGGVASVLMEYSKLFPDGYFISTTASDGFMNNLITLIVGFFKFIWILTFNRKIQIVHIHGASYVSFYRKFLFYILSRIYRKKIIYHIHGAMFHVFYKEAGYITRYLMIRMLNDVDSIVCLSRKWHDFFITNFTPKRIEIIPNIVGHPSLLIKPKNQNSDGFIKFLFLGYISERKGIWLLLETLKLIKDELQGKAIFNIGGNGEISTLISLITELKLEGIVNYIGWISEETKGYYLNDADAFILPSYNEGLPISLLEAMAYKLPIISTEVGGIPEIVQTGKNGMLIEPGNIEQLSEAITFFVTNPDLILKYGENSTEIVKEHFPENVKLRLNSLYSSIKPN